MLRVKRIVDHECSDKSSRHSSSRSSAGESRRDGSRAREERLGREVGVTDPTQPKVLHVATTDLGDGAGIAAFRLHAGLRLMGIDSSMAVLRKCSDRSDVHEIARPFSATRFARLGNLACDAAEVALNQVLAQNAVSACTRRLLSSPLVGQNAIFNLHALHRRRRHFAADLCLSLSRRGPVVWTLHDMWAFTGHCTYAFECERWRLACGSCPTLQDPVKLMLDTSAKSLRFKQRVYSASDFVVVTPSRWLADLARTSPLLAGKRIEHIPNGIDTRLYRPIDKEKAREQLGLPRRENILLSSASSFTDRRKGLRFITETLARDPNPGGVLLIMGNGAAPENTSARWQVRHLGFIAEQERQALVYSAADALVFPSLADNLPNTVVEAMACGTAVLAFEVGGLPELVRVGETGWLAPAGDAHGLVRGIEWLFADEERLRRIQSAAAAKIRDHYGLQLQADRYLGLYRELLAARSR